MTTPLRFRTRRVGPRRSFAIQIAASLTAAVCVAALFGGNALPPSAATMAGDTGKSMRRVANAQNETVVLRFDPQQQAALASLASFQPTAAPAPALPAVVATARPVAPKPVAVLPPPRPVFEAAPATAAAGPVAPKPAEAPEGWRVGGVEIPGTAHVRRYGDAAWTVSASAVKKVAGLGSLFGL